MSRGPGGADILALLLALVPVPGADHHQPRVLALGAGVRLQGDRVEAGDLGEHRLEPVEELIEGVPVEPVEIPPAVPAVEQVLADPSEIDEDLAALWWDWDELEAIREEEAAA